MNYAVVLGSNLITNSNGVLLVEDGDTTKEFFRVRELFRERSEGSYLAIDCDIKDVDGNRIIKLAKNNPVAQTGELDVTVTKTSTTASRKDGTVVINIEQIDSNDELLPQKGPVFEYLRANPIEAIVRITGNFQAGGSVISCDEKALKINTNTVSGNLLSGTKGILIAPYGFSI